MIPSVDALSHREFQPQLIYQRDTPEGVIGLAYGQWCVWGGGFVSMRDIVIEHRPRMPIRPGRRYIQGLRLPSLCFAKVVSAATAVASLALVGQTGLASFTGCLGELNVAYSATMTIPKLVLGTSTFADR